MVELIVPIGWIGAFLWIRPDWAVWSDGLTFVWLLILIPVVIALAAIDLKHFILPDGLIVFGIVTTLVYRMMVHFLDGRWLNLGLDVVASGGLVLFFWVLILLTRGKGMGFGDVKLAFLVGLVSGWPGMLISTFAAFVLGAIVGVTLIVLRRKTLKAEIPFGPFLIIGTVIGLLFGEKTLLFFGF